MSYGEFRRVLRPFCGTRLTVIGSGLASDAAAARGPDAGWPRVSDITWIPLSDGEWALALLSDATRMEAARLVADLAHGLPPVSRPQPGETVAAVRVRDLQPASGPQPDVSVTAARVPPDMLGPRLGSAVVHQRRDGAVIYCDASQITGETADTLAALAGRAAEFALPADAQGECQVNVITVPCRKLPYSLHPALARAHAGLVEAYVCERQITAGLAAALSALGSAYAWCQGAGTALDDAGGWGA
jgi:hypothetical protein